jgi:hypothetical protein
MTLQTFMLSSAFWITGLSVNLMMLMIFRNYKSRSTMNNPFIHCFNWGVPAIIAATLPFLGNKREFVYGDATLWCWIDSSYPQFRLIFFYMPMVGMFIFNIIVYWVIWVALRRYQKITKRNMYAHINLPLENEN